MNTTNTELVYFNESPLAQALPNLDGFDASDLSAFRAECKQVEAVLANLRSYAEASEYAAQARLAGKIVTALKFESAANTVYERLPKWARW